MEDQNPPTPQPMGQVPEVMPPSPGDVQQPLGKVKKSSKLKLFIIIGVVLAVLIGGSAAAYFGYVVPNQPTKVLGAAVKNTLNTEKLQSTKFEFSIDSKDSENTINFSGTGSIGEGKVQADVKIDTDSVDPEIALRVVDGNLYIKLDGLDDASLKKAAKDEKSEVASVVNSLGTLLIQQLRGKWYSFSANDVSSVDSLTGFGLPTSYGLSSEESQQLVNSIDVGAITEIKKVVGDEDVKGVNSTHFVVKIKKEGLKNFLEQNTGVLGSAATSISAQINDSNIDMAEINLWVDKTNKIVNKISFDSSSVGTDGTFSFELTLFDINSAVDITAPESSTTFQELFNELFSRSLYDSSLLGSFGQ